MSLSEVILDVVTFEEWFHFTLNNFHDTESEEGQNHSGLMTLCTELQMNNTKHIMQTLDWMDQF